MKSRMLDQPLLDVGMLVGRVVVEDQMEVEIVRALAVDPAQEPDELLVAVARATLADDRSVQAIQC